MRFKQSLLLLISIFLVSCVEYDNTLFRIQQNGLYGFINNKGEIVIEPQYKYVGGFSKEGLACVINQLKIEINNESYKKDSCIIVNYSYINKKNQRVKDGDTMIITPNLLSFWGEKELYKMVKKYNDGFLDFRSELLNQLSFNDGLYIFQDEESKLLGYKDIQNNIVIVPEYDRCNGFCNGVAVVFEPMQSIIDNTDFADTLSLYRILNRCGAINTKGDIIIDYEYSIIQNYLSNGTTWAMTISPSDYGRVTEDWVCINKNGTVITGPIGSADGGWVYNNDEFPIFQMDFGFLGKYYTFIDKNGNYLSDFDNDGVLSLPFGEDSTPEMFNDVIRFSDGIAGLYANYRNTTGWYFIDSTLLPISTAYDSILPFSENMAAVKELAEGYRVCKWGFVKKNISCNSVIQAIPFIYSECGSFQHGLAYFSNKGNAYDVEGYINKDGDIVWQTKRKKLL